LNPLTALLEVKLFPNMRDLDARFVAWKGGAVYAKLESTVESWISVEDWMSFGARAIKEKIPFIQ
jgi:actin-related protein 8